MLCGWLTGGMKVCEVSSCPQPVCLLLPGRIMCMCKGKHVRYLVVSNSALSGGVGSVDCDGFRNCFKLFELSIPSCN